MSKIWPCLFFNSWFFFDFWTISPVFLLIKYVWKLWKARNLNKKLTSELYSRQNLHILRRKWVDHTRNTIKIAIDYCQLYRRNLYSIVFEEKRSPRMLNSSVLVTKYPITCHKSDASQSLAIECKFSLSEEWRIKIRDQMHLRNGQPS